MLEILKLALQMYAFRTLARYPDHYFGNRTMTTMESFLYSTVIILALFSMYL